MVSSVHVSRDGNIEENEAAWNKGWRYGKAANRFLSQDPFRDYYDALRYARRKKQLHGFMCWLGYYSARNSISRLLNTFIRSI